MNTIKNVHLLAIALLLGLTLTSATAQRAIFVDDMVADESFNYDNLEVPAFELIAGGPGKDGIPAIDLPTFTRHHPQLVPKPDAQVLAISYNGVEKAYPLAILAYHEIVNDDFGGQSVAVTYSPLCGSAAAYVTDRTQTKDPWQFGVSGLLYNNNLVLFDRETNSLWAQLSGRALSGPAAGTQLEPVPVRLTTWAIWQAEYPESKVLTTDTGFSRNYTCELYAAYAESERLRFPVTYADNRLAMKDRVLGVAVDGQYKAYPYALLASVTEEVFNGQELQFHYEASTQTAYVTDGAGQPYPAVSSYWFAWYNFYPATEIHGLTPASIRTAMSMTTDMGR